MFFARSKQKSIDARKKKLKFEETEDMADGSEKFTVSRDSDVSTRSRSVSKSSATGRGVGKPRKSFGNAKPRSRRRHSSELLEQHPCEEVAFAAGCGLRKSGSSDAAYLLRQSVSTTPSRSTKIREAWLGGLKAKTKGQYSPEEALGLLVQCRLSVQNYKSTQTGAERKHFSLYPCYDHVLDAKQNCYPAPGSVKITEDSAEVTLQALLKSA